MTSMTWNEVIWSDVIWTELKSHEINDVHEISDISKMIQHQLMTWMDELINQWMNQCMFQVSMNEIAEMAMAQHDMTSHEITWDTLW